MGLALKRGKANQKTMEADKLQSENNVPNIQPFLKDVQDIETI